MTRQILRGSTNAVLWEGEAETVRDAVQAVVATGADPFTSPPVSDAAKRRVAVMDRLFIQSPENDLDDPDHGV